MRVNVNTTEENTLRCCAPLDVIFRKDKYNRLNDDDKDRDFIAMMTKIVISSDDDSECFVEKMINTAFCSNNNKGKKLQFVEMIIKTLVCCEDNENCSL